MFSGKGEFDLADVNLDPFNLEVDYKIWFDKVVESGSQSLIGEKKIQLLIAIHQSGSIKAAAEQCDLDFKVAWDMIHSANERFAPHDLVVSTRGRGGGSYLSPLGLDILQQYERLNTIIKSILPKILDGCFADVENIKEKSPNDLNLQLHVKEADNTSIGKFETNMKNINRVFVIPIDK